MLRVLAALWKYGEECEQRSRLFGKLDIKCYNTFIMNHETRRPNNESEYNPKQPDGKLSRRRFLIGGAVLVAGLITPETPEFKQSSGKPSKPRYDTPEAAKPVSIEVEKIPKPPQFFELTDRLNNPETPDGAFMGAMVVKYADNPSRDLQTEADLINKYWRSKGLPRPAINNPSVHRLRMGGDITSETAEDFNILLDEAAVAHRDTDNGLVLIALHNITPVKGPVELNGVVYDQPQMGINELVMPGDVLEVILPSLKSPGFIDVFRFAAADSRTIAYPAEIQTAYERAPLDERVLPEDSVLARTYICWPPGQANDRLMVDWAPQNTETMPGTVQVL